MEEEQDCPCGKMKHEGMHMWPTCGTQAFTEGKGLRMAQEFKKDVTHGTTSSMNLRSHKQNYGGQHQPYKAVAFQNMHRCNPIMSHVLRSKAQKGREVGECLP